LTSELNDLASALAKLAERLGPMESARVCAKAAEQLMDKPIYPHEPNALASALAKLAERCSDRQLVELLKYPRCVGVGRDKVQAALNKRKK
jgi:hypothetical protein